ncbi:hypothetical protein RB2156 [Rhodopirellula baltica SH 1]|uniref:Uncharacterized protein n=1 Tax=Rhodopirellula baltica (strain DSM 10527 / NCIMB 13988 / SH1) TaxID=243090 RepID=Q7UWA8_RHOBA|nr:hypothetical protein RB2156 [Rhodopirellula baltica SH 1]
MAQSSHSRQPLRTSSADGCVSLSGNDGRNGSAGWSGTPKANRSSVVPRRDEH